MRSHVTSFWSLWVTRTESFQYRKRYEVTCDAAVELFCFGNGFEFQYRKRYEVTCDFEKSNVGVSVVVVSIPQAV